MAVFSPSYSGPVARRLSTSHHTFTLQWHPDRDPGRGWGYVLPRGTMVGTVGWTCVQVAISIAHQTSAPPGAGKQQRPRLQHASF